MLSRDAGLIRQELRIDGLMPLPVALGADIDRHASILLKDHFGPFGRIAQNAFDIITQALPPQQAAFGVRSTTSSEPLAVGLLSRPGQEAREIAHVVKLSRGGGIGKLIRFDEIDPPQFPRIDAQLSGRAVHQPLQHIDRLGPPGAAIGIDLHGVGVIALHMQIGVLHVIDAHQNLREQRRLNRLAELAVIGPEVATRVDTVSGDLVVFVKGEFGPRHQIAPAVVGKHGFGAL